MRVGAGEEGVEGAVEPLGEAAGLPEHDPPQVDADLHAREAIPAPREGSRATGGAVFLPSPLAGEGGGASPTGEGAQSYTRWAMLF